MDKDYFENDDNENNYNKQKQKENQMNLENDFQSFDPHNKVMDLMGIEQLQFKEKFDSKPLLCSSEEDEDDNEFFGMKLNRNNVD